MTFVAEHPTVSSEGERIVFLRWCAVSAADLNGGRIASGKRSDMSERGH